MPLKARMARLEAIVQAEQRARQICLEQASPPPGLSSSVNKSPEHTGSDCHSPRPCALAESISCSSLDCRMARLTQVDENRRITELIVETINALLSCAYFL